MENNGNADKTRESGLMKVAEAAAFLRLKISTIRAWVLKRKIPYIKLGGKVLFRKADLEAFVDKNVINAR